MTSDLNFGSVNRKSIFDTVKFDERVHKNWLKFDQMQKFLLKERTKCVFLFFGQIHSFRAIFADRDDDDKTAGFIIF